MLEYFILIIGFIVCYVYGFRWLDTYRSATDEKQKHRALRFTILLLLIGSICAIVLIVFTALIVRDRWNNNTSINEYKKPESSQSQPLPLNTSAAERQAERYNIPTTLPQ